MQLSIQKPQFMTVSLSPKKGSHTRKASPSIFDGGSLSPLKSTTKLKETRVERYLAAISQYFMSKGTLIREIKFQNCTIVQKIANKASMAQMISNQIYNVEKVTFHRIKAENIFTVESLIQGLEKFLLIRDLEFDECCTRFTDKFFAHFASKKAALRFLPNIQSIKLKKVVINQINMAAEVFFDCFDKDQLVSIELEDCFKSPPVQVRGQNRRQGSSLTRNNQWDQVYQAYVNQAQHYLNYSNENLLEPILLKNTKLKKLALRNSNLQEDFFTRSFYDKYAKQQRECLEYLDISNNDLNVDGLKTIGRFLVEQNCRNLRVLKLSSISHFAYISEDFTEQLTYMFNRCQASFTANLEQLDLSNNSLGDHSLLTLVPLWKSYQCLRSLNLGDNRLTDRFLSHFFTQSLSSLKSLDISDNAFDDWELWLKKDGLALVIQLERLDVRKAYSKEGGGQVYRQIQKRIADVTRDLQVVIN